VEQRAIRQAAAHRRARPGEGAEERQPQAQRRGGRRKPEEAEE
jgi:hypothetical protein